MIRAYYKSAAVALLGIGSIVSASAFAAEPAKKSCCDQKLACCSANQACCAAPAKLGCCDKGLACCKSDKACCTGPQSCCVEGKDCCDEAKACCGTKAEKQAAKAPTASCCASNVAVRQ